MSDPSDERDPLDQLAEDFLERSRRGESPSIGEYAHRLPGRAAEVRDFLSVLLMVEGVKPRRDETVDHASRDGAAEAAPGPEPLGDFRIIREVGRGGMGVVYEAEQVSLGRRVALKILSPAVARTPQQVQRFLREARSAAQLHHTNIVPVFGVGDQDGLYYYAMQFIIGQGLDKVLAEVKRRKRPVADGTSPGDESTPAEPSLTLIAQGLFSRAPGSTQPAPPSTVEPEGPPATLEGGPDSPFALDTESDRLYARSVARIGVQVADALDYAHRRGTIHRDIKPSNLLLDLAGNVWVADFGLAKAAEDDDLTRTGDLVGTLRYMAPERFRGDGDARSDVHALGLTLYEMVALRPAFEAQGREFLIYQMTEKEPPRLRSLNPATPRDLETIIHKAIERDAGDRYPTAGAMAEDLRCFLEHRPILARKVGPAERMTRWARRNPGLASLGTLVAGLLALTVAIIAVADFRLRREHGVALDNLRRAEAAEADAVARLLESTLARARAGRGSGSAGRRLDGLEAIRDAVCMDVDSRRVAEFRKEAIACLALDDLRVARRWPGLPDQAGLGLDFDPALARLALGTPRGEILIRDIGGKGVLDRWAESPHRAVFLRFSPDGRHLAAKHEAEGARGELAVYDLERKVTVLRVPDGLYEEAFDFSPDGKAVAAGRRDGSIVLYDLASGREWRRLPPSTIPRTIRFDPSGRRIAVVSPRSDRPVQVRRVDDGRVEAEWSRPEGAGSVDWHPEGRWIAVGGEDGRIHLCEPDRPANPPRILEGHGGTVLEVAHHPSGDLLASASRDGTLRLWDVRAGREVLKAAIHEPHRLRFGGGGRFLGPGHDGTSACLWEVVEGAESRIGAGTGRPSPVLRSVESLRPGGLILGASGAGLHLQLPGAGIPGAFAAVPEPTGPAVAPDGSFAITGGPSGLLRWPVSRSTSGEVRLGPPSPIGPRKGHPTGRIRLGRDGRTLGAILDEEAGRVAVIDLRGDRPPIELVGHPKVERLDVSPDGRWVATGTSNGATVQVWDARGGTLAVELPVVGGSEVLFSPDGRSLLTGSGADYRLWEVGRWSESARIPRRPAAGLAAEAAFDADGRLLAVAKSRTIIGLVDPATGRELAELEPTDLGPITGLRFDFDGRLLALSPRPDVLRAWDLARVRRGLDSLGLDWGQGSAGPEAEARPPSPIRSIVAESAPWLEPFDRAEAHAREGRWDRAAAAYREAIDAGSPGFEPWSRLAMARLILGDHAGYREVCRYLLHEFCSEAPALKTANNLAWSCALGPDALGDYEVVVRLARSASESRPEINRLNTLGAVLYRAGRFEEAIRPLERSVSIHGAGGTPYDALILAMSHHRLGHRDEARAWLRRASPVPVAMRKPDALGPSSWIPRVEIEVLRKEAAALIETPVD